MSEHKLSNLTLKITITFLSTIVFSLIFFILSFWFYKSTFRFIGGIFLQASVTIIIFELFISKMSSDFQREAIRSDFRESMGINNENKYLLQELIHLNNPHPYTVSDMNINMKLEESKEVKNRYDVVSDTSVKIIAKEDNVHYDFQRDTALDTKSRILSVEMNGFNLNIDDELYDDKNGRYQIKKKLKKDGEYVIKIKSVSIGSMSDLKETKEGIERKEDWFDFKFIELTKNLKLTIVFPFSIDEFNFFSKKTDSCRRRDPIKIKRKKNKITLSSENLYNNDVIRVLYQRKNTDSNQNYI